MQHILRLLKSARELWGYYLLISLFTIFISLLSLLMPLMSGWAIDEMRKGSLANVKYVALLAFGIFLLDFLQNLASNVGGYIGDQMSQKLNRILGIRYYEKLLTLPQKYFDGELSGKIIRRLDRSIVQISNFMNMMSNNFLQFIVSTVFSLIVVAIYSWQVALMLFALYPIYVWMTFKSSDTWQKYQEKKNYHADVAGGRFIESISQIKVVKSYIQEKRELGFFTKHLDAQLKINRPQSNYWHVNDFKRRLVLNFIFLGVYMYIFVVGARGGFTPGQVVTLMLFAMQIRIPIFTISFLVENTQRAVADSKEYFEIMNTKAEIADTLGATSLKVKNAQIAFENVSFSYDSKQPVLKNINLQIKPDTKVALVGESGEGKTTLANLLLRLYEPEAGTIKIDNQDIHEVTQKSLRANIGVVFQEPALFSGTIRENIAYANNKAGLPAIKAAAKAANADEFIAKLENGYDTEIGERGLKLSGGQKQRIAIARALLKDAPILILDEATSSLDSKSELMVQEALERLMKQRTTIIIAHRLSTIQHVDTIVTLKNGQIDEVGSPAELARSGGIYDQLLKLQRGKKTETTTKKLQQYDISA